MLVTISDKKLAVASTTDPNLIAYYNADVVTANDYYPFGMTMPGRKFTQPNSSYRYGFNGQENSDEIGAGLTTAMYWEYDSRIGRRWNVDPILKEWESPYLCFSGNPILFSDINGDDSNKGPDKPIYTAGTNLEPVIIKCVIKKKKAFTIDSKNLVKANVTTTCHTSNEEITNAFNESYNKALAAVNNGKGLDIKGGQVALPTTSPVVKFLNLFFGPEIYTGRHPTTGEFSINGFAIKNDGYVDTHPLPTINIVHSVGIKGGLPVVFKAVNSNLPHAVTRGVQHGIFVSTEEASLALKALTKSISKNKSFPIGSFKDPSYLDRVLVPVGANGLAAYQVAKNGTAAIKTVLIAN